MFKLFLEMSMLALDVRQAVWLRSRKIASAGCPEREASSMLSEKISAAQNDVLKAVTGTGPVRMLGAIVERSGPMVRHCRGRSTT